MDRICMYHDDMDGLASAYAVYKAVGECEFIAMQYGDEPPDVTGKDVYIVDFSFKREVMIKLIDEAGSLLVIDHHKTAEKELDGLPGCVFDKDKSGCVLTWETLITDEYVPGLFYYIQDRDLWQWELDKSQEINAGIYLQDCRTVEDVGNLLNVPSPSLIKTGRNVLAYQQLEIRKVINREHQMIELAGYNVPVLNRTSLISEVGNELANAYPFVVMYFDTADKRVFSLRSSDDGPDVSEIARMFGGGGHRNAAGFTVDKPDIGV